MIALMLLPVYLIINIYIFWRLYRWTKLFSSGPWHKYFRLAVALGFIFCSSALLIGFLLGNTDTARFFKVIGNYWAAVQIFSLPVLALFEIVLLVWKRTYGRRGDTSAYIKFVKKTGAVCLSVVFLLALVGSVNAKIIRTTDYNVTVQKKVEGVDNLRIVLLSDLHLGVNFDCNQTERLVNKINAKNPDIVLIAGDIFDNNFEAVDEPERMAQIFKGIKSKYGTFTCYGNHDIEEKILAGFTFSSDKPKVASKEMNEFLKASNITLLRDEYRLVDNKFYIYGRPDFERPGEGIKVRKSPQEVTAELDKSKPIIVLDHEPREQEELSKAGVDLDLCGHTHGGQIFPGDIIIKFFWNNSYGAMDFGSMKNIVTSGVGNFGPNVRLGAKTEICLISINFP